MDTTVLRALGVVKVHWIVDKALHSFEERNEDCCVTKSVVSCSDCRHETSNFDFITILGVDVSTLFNFACANESLLVSDWAKWCDSRVIAESADVGQDDLAEGFLVQA